MIFCSPAPDAEFAYVGEYNHRWIVDNMTDFILRKLKDGWETPEYRWSAMLNLPEKTKASVTTKQTTAAMEAIAMKPAAAKANAAAKNSKEQL